MSTKYLSSQTSSAHLSRSASACVRWVALTRYSVLLLAAVLAAAMSQPADAQLDPSSGSPGAPDTVSGRVSGPGTPTDPDRQRTDHEPATYEFIRFQGDEGPVRFISERALSETPIDELPVDCIDRGILRRRVDEKENPERAARYYRGHFVPECRPAYLETLQYQEPDGGDVGEPSIERFLDQISTHDLVFVAQVREIVPGWDTGLDQVGRLLALQVEENLKPKRPLPRSDDGSVLLILPGGRIELDDLTLCDTPPEGTYEPVLGERLLITGYPCSAGRCVALSRMIHLDGEWIEPFKGPHRKTETAPISELRTRLHPSQR